MSNEALMLLAFVGVMEWGMGFITGVLPFLLFGMLLFRFRVMGAGDGKLMAVIGGYLGIQSGFYAVALGFLAGAVWSLWRLRQPGLAVERFCYLQEYVRAVMQGRCLQPYDSLEHADAPHIFRLRSVWRWGLYLWRGAVDESIIVGEKGGMK